MLTPIALTFLVNAATQFFKKFIIPRFGETGVHVILFTFSVIAALYFTYGDQYPGIKDILLVGVQIFCLAIALYEVLLKHLSFVSKMFKSSGENKEAA